MAHLTLLWPYYGPIWPDYGPIMALFGPIMALFDPDGPPDGLRMDSGWTSGWTRVDPGYGLGDPGYGLGGSRVRPGYGPGTALGTAPGEVWAGCYSVWRALQAH